VSRQVIHDVVIPIVSKVMVEDRYISPHEMPNITDPGLEEFLEEELRRLFGVIGANGCQHLKEQLEQARKNDPFEFDQIIRQLLRKYVKLQIKMRHAKEMKELENGPPDRFSQQRRRYPLLGSYQ
jgi:hypothetical protein